MNEPWQRRALEKRLSDPAGSLSEDLPLAARKLFYLERRNLLMFEAELFKVILCDVHSALAVGRIYGDWKQSGGGVYVSHITIDVFRDLRLFQKKPVEYFGDGELR